MVGLANSSIFMLSTCLTYLVQVVKIVAVDFGGETVSFRSARKFVGTGICHLTSFQKLQYLLDFSSGEGVENLEM